MKKLIALIFISSIVSQDIALAKRPTHINLDDWVTFPVSTNPRQKLCGGYYREKQGSGNAEKVLTIKSDSAEHTPKKESIFTSNVYLERGLQGVVADKLILKHNSETENLDEAIATGNVTLTEPGKRIDGSFARIDYVSNKKYVEKPIYRLYNRHGFGWADNLIENNKESMKLERAHYTTCAPQSNTWRIKSRQLKFDYDEGRGEAWHSFLYVKDVPVFYWPYIDFPIDDRRQTGFLTPSIGHSNRNGASLTTPYYINIAPNYDATISPKYMSRRGFKFDNEFRYLTNESNGTLHISYLPHDRGYRRYRKSSLDDNTFASTDARVRGLRDFHKRHSLKWKNTTKFSEEFDLDVDYTRIGDDNYAYDFPEDFHQEINYGQPLQRATATLRKEIGGASFTMQQYNTLHPYDGPIIGETYRLLPAINLYSKSFEFKDEVTVNAYGSYSHFKMRDIPHVERLTTGKRYHARPSITREFTEAGWFIKPQVQWDFLNYSDLNLNSFDVIRGKSKSASRGIPIYSIDNGLIFERDVNIYKNSYQQTLEPRVYYLYVPKRDQNKLPIFDSGLSAFSYSQVFSDNRYTSVDRLGNANQFGMGTSSYFIDDITGVEKAHISLGRIIYMTENENLAAENISHKKWSPYAIEASYYLFNNWSINATNTRLPLNTTQTASLTAQYSNKKNIINIGYQFYRNDVFNELIGRKMHTRQIQVSSAWNVTPNARVLGRVDYDLNLSRLRNALVGFEQEWCCTILRMMWGREVLPSERILKPRRDSKLYIQFVLKGFTDGLGNASSVFIQDKIPGYAPENKSFI